MNYISYKSTTYKSKWVKTKWLMKSSDVLPFIPETRKFSHQNVVSMLNKYNTIYFKPTDGSGGAKIVKISKKNDGYSAKHRSTVKNFTTISDLTAWMKSFAGSRLFILQKGIILAKTNGRPFDIRVMVQKDSDGVWQSTAMFAKVGVSGKVATNYNQGGSIKFIDQTLAGANYSDTEQEATKKALRQLGQNVANVFSKKNKGFRELGLDVAIDRDKKLWILEVNTRPQIYPLKNMKDKSLYNKIISYGKQYGRNK